MESIKWEPFDLQTADPAALIYAARYRTTKTRGCVKRIVEVTYEPLPISEREAAVKELVEACGELEI